MQYNILSLSQPTRAFISDCSSKSINLDKSFSTAVAYVLANKLALPSMEVKDSVNYYQHNHGQDVLNQLGSLNELIPFDTKLARNLVAKFYSYRVASAFPPAIPLAMNQETAIIDFFNLNRHFDQDTLENIRKDSARICSLISGLTEFYREIIARQIKDQARWNANNDSNGDHIVE